MNFDTKVIQQVQKYPSLYDANDGNYNNQKLKRSIWNAIATKVCRKKDSKSVRKVQESWNRVKSNFEKIYESSKKSPNAGRNKALQFLLPYVEIKPKRLRSGISYEEPVDEHSMFEIDYSDADTPVPIPASKSKTNNERTDRDERKSVMTKISPCYVRMEKGITLNSTGKKLDPGNVRPEDSSKFVSKSLDFKDGSPPSGKDSSENWGTKSHGAVDSFFQGIADTVKSLDPVNQVLAQKHIANLVLDYKLREVDEKEEGESKASDSVKIGSKSDSYDEQYAV